MLATNSFRSCIANLLADYMDYIVLQSMTGLECGHLYCTTCWTEYLTVKIMDEGASQSIQCPTGDCQMLVDDATVLRLVKDARVTLKYQHLITNSFVTVRTEKNIHMKVRDSSL